MPIENAETEADAHFFSGTSSPLGLHNMMAYIHTHLHTHTHTHTLTLSQMAHMSWQAMRIGFDIHTNCIIEVSENIAAHVK